MNGGTCYMGFDKGGIKISCVQGSELTCVCVYLRMISSISLSFFLYIYSSSVCARKFMK